MGKINREELHKILDKQHEQCKLQLTLDIEALRGKLDFYTGDVIDIKTEISMGNTLEGSLFKSVNEDYYDRQKLLSVPTAAETDTLKFTASYKNANLLFEPDSSPYKSVTAPSSQQFTKQELKQLVDMLVSLMLYMKQSPKADEVKTIYSKILGLI